MQAIDVINHSLSNPPFEITNAAKYAEFLNYITNFTLMELSENSDYMDETKFTTSAPANPEDEVVLFDLSTIHPRFMELVVLEETNKFPESLYFAVSNSVNGYTGVSAEALRAAMNGYSVISYLSIKNYMYIIQEWFMTKMKKLVYRKSEIKLKPSTEYYSLFRCYKSIDDITQSEMRMFKELFDINLNLHIYQSDIFAAEGGLRSVSLSGLSVSFNVPDAENKVNSLKKAKSEVLNNFSLDYDGMIGLI